MTTDRDTLADMELALQVRHDLRYYLRGLMGLGAGAVAALMGAWFMHYLIASSDVMLANVDRVQMLDFVRVKREENVERKERTPDRPKLNETPEVPPMPQSDADASGQQLAVSMLPTTGSIDINQGGIGFGSGEGDYLPIVKVAPIFPQRALAQGIFGQCLVRYTVTTAGTVKDVEVLKDECTNAVFYRPSRDAALRFKYKPRVIDGEAVEVHGVLNMFYYEELEQEE
jgi:protein TonB